jgi:hypothetical protein
VRWWFSESNPQITRFHCLSILRNLPITCSTHQRSLEPENLDKGSYTPEEYEGCLVELRRVSEWLGD